MSFATAINCIDGRTKEPLIAFLKDYYNVKYIDMVTEPGPVKDLSGNGDDETAQAMLRKTKIAIDAHGSAGIAVIAHHDCAGNPIDDDTQKKQIFESIKVVKDRFPDMDVIGIWMGVDWKVEKL